MSSLVENGVMEPSVLPPRTRVKDHGGELCPYACEGCSRARQKSKKAKSKALRRVEPDGDFVAGEVQRKSQVPFFPVDRQIPPYMAHINRGHADEI